MLRVVRALPEEELFFFFHGDEPVAFTYPLSESGDSVWAVSGDRKPFAANIDDFPSFEAVKKFVEENLWQQ
jgi:hypothetical protein